MINTVWRELLVPSLIQGFAYLRSNVNVSAKKRGPPDSHSIFTVAKTMLSKKNKNKLLILILLYYVSRTMLKITIHVKVGKKKNGDKWLFILVRLLSLCMFSLLVSTEPHAVGNDEFAWCRVLHVGTFPNDVSSFLQDIVCCTFVAVPFFVFVLWEEPKRTL